MWKINGWLVSLSARDTHFSSAVLRQPHVPALQSWYFPLVPLRSDFIVPGAGGRNKRMPELWPGWQRLCNSSWVRRGRLELLSEGRTLLTVPCPRRVMPCPHSPPCPPAAGSHVGQLLLCCALRSCSPQLGLCQDAPVATISPAPRLCLYHLPLSCCYPFRGQFLDSSISDPGTPAQVTSASQSPWDPFAAP